MSDQEERKKDLVTPKGSLFYTSEATLPSWTHSHVPTRICTHI